MVDTEREQHRAAHLVKFIDNFHLLKVGGIINTRNRLKEFSVIREEVSGAKGGSIRDVIDECKEQEGSKNAAQGYT